MTSPRQSRRPSATAFSKRRMLGRRGLRAGAPATARDYLLGLCDCARALAFASIESWLVSDGAIDSSRPERIRCRWLLWQMGLVFIKVSGTAEVWLHLRYSPTNYEYIPTIELLRNNCPATPVYPE